MVKSQETIVAAQTRKNQPQSLAAAIAAISETVLPMTRRGNVVAGEIVVSKRKVKPFTAVTNLSPLLRNAGMPLKEQLVRVMILAPQLTAVQKVVVVLALEPAISLRPLTRKSSTKSQ